MHVLPEYGSSVVNLSHISMPFLAPREPYNLNRNRYLV